MSELQDMLRVQARLHRKQGANALGDLFENALNEIELLKKTYNQLFDAVQSEREQLAKANERVRELERQKEILEYYNGDVNALIDKFLPKFAIEKQLSVLDKVESVYMQAAETSEPISFREAFDAVEEELRKEQAGE